MKIVALFLLLTFSGTILLPVAMSLTKQNQVSLFIVDEEKSNNTGQFNEIKVQKQDYSGLYLTSMMAIADNTSQLPGDGRRCSLPPSPYLEYVAPPPNVC